MTSKKTEIEKHKYYKDKLTPEGLSKVDKVLAEYSINLSVGDMFFGDRHYNDILRIDRIKVSRHPDWDLIEAKFDGRRNWAEGLSEEEQDKYCKDHVNVHFEKLRDRKTFTWSSYGDNEIHDFLKRYAGNRFLFKDFADMKDTADKVISGEISISEYAEGSEDDNAPDALMHLGSKESLVTMVEVMELQKLKARSISNAVHYEMERRKAEIAVIVDELNEIVVAFEKKISKMHKVIATIELYLGIDEDIIQIQEGPLAPADMPISFRQEVLCMDEEVGDPTDDGIDLSNIKEFDNWLLRYSKWYGKENYKLVLPEEKGIVAFRLRRKEKERSEFKENPFARGAYAAEEMKTYILIRNGDSIFRIWADVNIWPRLFPKKDELQLLKDEWDNLVDETGVTYRSAHFNDRETEAIDNKLFKYKKQLILLQGLIDRTQVLSPMANKIQLMSSEPIEKGWVNFIYDDEIKLTDGKYRPYSEWMATINSTLAEGSRIFVSGRWSNDREDYVDRFSGQYSRGRYYGGKQYYNLPDMPGHGVYTVHTRGEKVYVTDKGIANNSSEVPKYEKERFSDGYFDDEAMMKKYHDSSYPYEYVLRNDKGHSTGGHQAWIKNPCIKYAPGDEIYTGGSYGYYRTRKNRVSFLVYLNHDNNIINFDGLTISDIDYYLNTREHRKGYLHMMPVLIGLKKMLLEEQEHEDGFILMLQNKLIAKEYSEERAKEKIQETITWWKTKNKWKRPLSQNDAKALRMIEKRLKIHKK